MWVLIAIGLLIAGIGWALDKGHLETVGCVCAVAGLAMLVVAHWPVR